ncbi:MAG: tRNA uridine-5-carboxymethylaminomethyl(34) synthesis GTPase MnmE [Rickettsiales bacterium]|jgi:tRNA modification GTPase|nr:tRNA uridine-5-carboxymethylaminomethyl(34) synthesis GTPase MnmE [Rickettsiales bacterium]
MTDTIFALSSGHGRAGIAVIRISGANLRGLFASIVSPVGSRVSPPYGGETRFSEFEITPRHAYLADLADDAGDVIDRAIAIYFSAPNSFTGEDVIEFHTHGSQAVIQKLFDTLKSHGARMAEPGEFTRRAFHNSKMDLAEVDGLCALIDSRTDKQRARALKSMAGADSAAYENWRNRMIEIAAYSAAMLDYPSDELPQNIGKTLLSRTKELHDEITAALARANATRAVQSGFNIALAGPVNAGKSSLFNRLVGESRAIVSDIPGTTRDVITAEIDVDGYLVRLLDTAGLRDTDDPIENMGISRTMDACDNADMVIRLQSAKHIAQSDDIKDNEIVVVNKSDLHTENSALQSANHILVSALTGKGIPELLEIIKRKVHEMLDGAESDVVVNARTKTLLEESAAELNQAISNNSSHDIFAEHARAASDAIGRILGIIGADEIADKIFGQLCLGK